jgi:hypothetical protein
MPKTQLAVHFISGTIAIKTIFDITFLVSLLPKGKGSGLPYRLKDE